jgi:energy-converting hydrogenase Eha subunit B
MKKIKTPVPTPVKIDSRICFAIAYFTTPADAAAYAKVVEKRGDTYNGGFFHGMPCGRDASFDYTDPETGQMLYAVTT